MWYLGGPEIRLFPVEITEEEKSAEDIEPPPSIERNFKPNEYPDKNPITVRLIYKAPTNQLKGILLSSKMRLLELQKFLGDLSNNSYYKCIISVGELGEEEKKEERVEKGDSNLSGEPDALTGPQTPSEQAEEEEKGESKHPHDARVKTYENGVEVSRGEDMDSPNPAHELIAGNDLQGYCSIKESPISFQENKYIRIGDLGIAHRTLLILNIAHDGKDQDRKLFMNRNGHLEYIKDGHNPTTTFVDSNQSINYLLKWH